MLPSFERSQYLSLTGKYTKKSGSVAVLGTAPQAASTRTKTAPEQQQQQRVTQDGRDEGGKVALATRSSIRNKSKQPLASIRDIYGPVEHLRQAAAVTLAKAGVCCFVVESCIAPAPSSQDFLAKGGWCQFSLCFMIN